MPRLHLRGARWHGVMGCGGRADRYMKTRPDGTTIMLLVNTFDMGGAERVYIELARGLVARGHRVIAACLQSRSGDVGEELSGSGVVLLNCDLTLRQPLGLLRLVRGLRQHRVQVLYTFLIHSHVLGRVAGRLAGVPVILSSQQIMDWEGRFAELLNRLTSRWCTVVVAVSHKVEAYLADRLRIPAGKLTTIHNSVDYGRFENIEAQRFRPGRTGPVIGSVARLNPEKDHDTLLVAFGEIRRRFPHARLVLAGGGPERARLEAKIRALGLEAAVSVLGHVKDVAAVYADLDVYVQSSHTEGLSVALLEAMACRLPVAAARVGGTEEVVQEGETGLLFEPGDSGALTGAIGRFLDYPEQARAMAEAGRRLVVRRFGAARMVDETDRLITRLLAAGASTVPAGGLPPL